MRNDDGNNNGWCWATIATVITIDEKIWQGSEHDDDDDNRDHVDHDDIDVDNDVSDRNKGDGGCDEDKFGDIIG